MSDSMNTKAEHFPNKKNNEWFEFSCTFSLMTDTMPILNVNINKIEPVPFVGQRELAWARWSAHLIRIWCV